MSKNYSLQDDTQMVSRTGGKYAQHLAHLFQEEKQNRGQLSLKVFSEQEALLHEVVTRQDSKNSGREKNEKHVLQNMSPSWGKAWQI